MRILMLGNSLTTANDLPNRLAEMLNAEVTTHARSGARLAEHLNPKTKNGKRTLEALKSENWDFVIMQEMSHAPATTPDAFKRSFFALCELAKEANAAPVLYATWAYATTCPKLETLGMSHSEMHAKMHESFEVVAEYSGALLADVGSAFEASSRISELYAVDGIHPSEQGTNVAAHVIASTILNNRVTARG